MKTAYERFMAKVIVTEGGCWAWSACTQSKGYGLFGFGGKGRSVLAHRWSYELWMGDIPAGMQLDHACHTRDLACKGGKTCPHRRCVNPTHLEPVTAVENTQRGEPARKAECKHGHPFDEANTRRNGKGRRQCRACAVRHKADWKQRQPNLVPPGLLLGAT